MKTVTYACDGCGVEIKPFWSPLVIAEPETTGDSTWTNRYHACNWKCAAKLAAKKKRTKADAP